MSAPRRSAAVLTAGALSAVALATATLAFARPPARGAAPTVVRRYGGSAAIGAGRARAYVLVDRATNAPTEVGVALDERALEALPATGHGHHAPTGPMHRWELALPDGLAAPFRFVEVNWNPTGHEPDGVYRDVPHFDFHFYTVSRAERDRIVPSSPTYAADAAALPGPDFVPEHNAQLGPPGSTPADVAVPQMGVHWVDMRSPELQALLGKPDAYRPFTRTFIHGSWAGRLHFWEPMISRAHLLAKRGAADAAVRDEVVPLPLPRRYQQSGHYPTAYRITWDERSREYRVALTHLVRRG